LVWVQFVAVFRPSNIIKMLPTSQVYLGSAQPTPKRLSGRAVALITFALLVVVTAYVGYLSIIIMRNSANVDALTEAGVSLENSVNSRFIKSKIYADEVEKRILDEINNQLVYQVNLKFKTVDKAIKELRARH
jgi:hypothetical protein